MTETDAMRVTDLADSAPSADPRTRDEALALQRRLAKPPGSLGRLEDLAAQLAASAGRCPPPVPTHPAVLVAVADHGVHAHGVSPWPQTLTAQMADQIAAGTTTLGAFARTVGADWRVVDVGTTGAGATHPALIKSRVREGTADWTRQPAMSRDQAARATMVGADAAAALLDEGVDLLVHGEMGLANTTTAAAMIAALTGRPATDVTGPGTNPKPGASRRKAQLVDAALDHHRPDPSDPLGLLAAIGGLEHAALAGATLAAASRRVPTVLDGVSSVAAALLAAALTPTVTDHLIAGHRSPEPGASVGLDTLRLVPLLDLDLRLGEGTGSVLAVPMIIAAAQTLSQVLTLEALKSE